jgi:hypothetical protein
MYAQCEDGLVASGNAVRYEHPVHKDTNGKIVDDVSLAFGHPVTINYVRPENVFFLDETGDNAHGKDDGNRGGQRKVVPRGEIPKELVGVKDSHYTITPITNATGTLRFVTVIFVAKEVSPVWSLGVDIFAEWDPEDEFNMGPGKRHPGLSLISTVDGKDIPVLFAANPKASMTSTILTQTFKKMDEAGITQRGVDKNGNQYVPAAVFDGHISRMGEDFLRYINKEGSCWEANIGASYGTEYWQLHDDKRQNGAFKSELLLSKSKFYYMKGKNYKLTVDKLRLLVTYKKTKEDAAIPSGKANLLARWNETKHRLSPRCSPNNSDDEEEEEEEEEEGMGTTGLVFDDSDNECEE